jgi:rhomboid protease GluP
MKNRFPAGELLGVSTLVLVHLSIVVWAERAGEAGWSLVRQGALLAGRTMEEPWRLLTSLLLHGDPQHVLWNGLSMAVFAVPLLADLGILRTLAIYLAAGVGGGIAAVSFAPTGSSIIGSSGAVSGLFGAWVVMTLWRARATDLPRRSRIRALGLAMLVLPSLLNPLSSTGRPVSISSHVGGLATGMLIGALLARSFAVSQPEEGNGHEIL